MRDSDLAATHHRREAAMPFTTPRAVISGKPYAVQSVRDRTPERLEEFLGDTAFVLDLDGEGYMVQGPGVQVDHGVRVFEKDDDGFGKDIRVWMVCRTSTGDAFTATHIGIDVPAQAVDVALS
jgi:hypothetical protein